MWQIPCYSLFIFTFIVYENDFYKEKKKGEEKNLFIRKLERLYTNSSINTNKIINIF